MTDPGLFDYINMLSLTKKIPEFDEHFEKTYQPFLVNRFFSLSGDNSVLIANAINKNVDMPKMNHFLFLHGMVRKGKRYNKWPKKQIDDRVKFLMEQYNYSYKRAKEASVLITDDQILEMRKAQEQGGSF